jgi:AcrR family transcriptional regulator
MARKSKAKKTRRTAESTSQVPDANTPREKIVAALMDFLAERRFEEIDLAEIAEAAGVSLAELRDEFDSKLSILSAFLKQIDRTVLGGSTEAMAEESPRDRLFDVLMRRIDALTPYREAIESLMRSARRHPALALALNGLSVRSQRWMLTAAGITLSGPLGMVRAQGLALLFADVMRTFVDDDEDNSRTMAALDRALDSGQRWSGLLEDVCRLLPRPGRRRRRRARYEEDDMETA